MKGRGSPGTPRNETGPPRTGNMENIELDTEGIKARLADPATVLDALGLLDGARRQCNGYMLRCICHDDRRPSLSVRIGPCGTLQIVCTLLHFFCGSVGEHTPHMQPHPEIHPGIR